MNLPSLLKGVAGAGRALVTDPAGRVLESTGDENWAPEDDAAATASIVGSLAAAGSACGFNQLDRIQVRGANTASLTAVRTDGYLRVEVDPNRRTTDVEKALTRWASPGATHAPSSRAAELPARPAASSTSLPITVPAPAAPPTTEPAAGRDDLWSSLRRSLVRGHLTEAASLQQAIAEAPPAAQPRPGAEPLPAEEFRDTMQRLLEGIGSVLAGDTVGGARSLRDLATPNHPNVSFRWLGLYWSARAAMGGSGLEAARLLVKDALELSRQLDVEARAVSQLIAAELLARAGENDKALTWLTESRSRFERSGDAWGLGRTWLAEARVHASGGKDEESMAAAQRARDTDPAWDGPPLFLAGRALVQGDLAGAEGLLSELRTPAADRLRRLLEAVDQGLLSQADAAEFLRLHLAPPSTQGLRSLERIANAAPKFFQAREALAWMLVKLGKYPAARETFSWLLSQPLGPGDRALVMLGLSCIASATRTGDKAPDVSAEAGGPTTGNGAEPKPPPRLSESVLVPRSSQPGFAGLDAVFSGRLSVFSLPDLVEFLRSARRTGVLVCSSPAGMGSLRFREGWISGAGSPATPGVAELLVRAGKLSPEALQQVTEGQDGPPSEALIGEQFVRQGLVDGPAVEQALRQQIELTLRELVKWSDGEFAFSREEGDEAPPGMPSVRVDAQELLLTLFKEMDESSRGLASPDVET